MDGVFISEDQVISLDRNHVSEMPVLRPSGLDL
jgi:hypothetical protein